MKSKTLRKPVGDIGAITCRACGKPRLLEQYRIFATTPKVLYMDFCVECEKRESTLTLYRRYNAYGTTEIINAVFAADRIPEIRRSEDQVRLLVQARPQAEPETNEEVMQRELQRRELMRRRLVYYTTTFHPNYKPGWMHQDICRRLERFVRQVENSESPRLMICMPPRAGKSVLASDNFCSWVLGQHPEWLIIASSYAQSLPLDFSRSIRDRLRDPEYQAIYERTRIRQDAQGIESWKTTAGGGYLAAGVGTGITGKGFNIGIVDDPIKDLEEAMSEQTRDTTFGWYKSVFRTRAAPGAGILVISTRWHYDDPTGRLLEQQEEAIKAGVPEEERENWEVVSYPAIAEHDEYLMRNGTIEHDANPEDAIRLLRRKGEALHPERYPLPALLKLKNTLSSGEWNSLYQQAPTPESGDFFQREDIIYRWLDPAYFPLCRLFMCTDYAISEKRRRNWTVMGMYALTSDDDLYELEMRRGRWGSLDIQTNIVQMVRRYTTDKYRVEVYAGEQGHIHMGIWPDTQKALDAERLYVSVDETCVPIQDKTVRARPLQGRVQRRKFMVSYDSTTRPEVYDVAEREMLQFPSGVNDDTVDCRAWAARMALNLSLPQMVAPPKRRSWKDDLSVAPATRSHMMA